MIPKPTRTNNSFVLSMRRNSEMKGYKGFNKNIKNFVEPETKEE